jgi:hypothetical protein
MAQQHGKQLTLAEGFGQIVVEAEIAEALFVTIQRVGGDRDHRRAARGEEREPAVAAAPEPVQRLDAVHARHLDVHQHQIEGFLAQRPQPFRRPRHHLHPAAQAPQHLADYFLIHSIVFDNQHLPVEPQGRRQGVHA